MLNWKIWLNHIKSLSERLDEENGFKAKLHQIRKKINQRDKLAIKISKREEKAVVILIEINDLFNRLIFASENKQKITDEIINKLERVKRQKPNQFVIDLIKVLLVYWNLNRGNMYISSENQFYHFIDELASEIGLFIEFEDANQKGSKYDFLKEILCGNGNKCNLLSEVSKEEIQKYSGLNKIEIECLLSLKEIDDILMVNNTALSILVNDLTTHIDNIISYGNDNLLKYLEENLCEITPSPPIPSPIPGWVEQFPDFKEKIRKYSLVLLKNEEKRLKECLKNALKAPFSWHGLAKCTKEISIDELKPIANIFDEIKRLSLRLSDNKISLNELINLKEIIKTQDFIAVEELGNDINLLAELAIDKNKVSLEELTKLSWWNDANESIKNALNVSYERYEYEYIENELVKKPELALIDEKYPGLVAAKRLLSLQESNSFTEHKSNLQTIEGSWKSLGEDLRRKIKGHLYTIMKKDAKTLELNPFIDIWSQLPKTFLHSNSKALFIVSNNISGFNKNETDIITFVNGIPRGLIKIAIEWLKSDIKAGICHNIIKCLDRAIPENDLKKMTWFFASFISIKKRKKYTKSLVEFSAKLASLKPEYLDIMLSEVRGSDVRIIKVFKSWVEDNKPAFAEELNYLKDYYPYGAQLISKCYISGNLMSEVIKQEIRSTSDVPYLRMLVTFLRAVGINIADKDWPNKLLEQSNLAVKKVNEINENDIEPWLNGKKTCLHALRNINSLEISKDEQWLIGERLKSIKTRLDTFINHSRKLINEIPDAQWLVGSHGEKLQRLDSAGLSNLMQRLKNLDSAYCRNRHKLGNSKIIVSLFHWIHKIYPLLSEHHKALSTWDDFAKRKIENSFYIGSDIFNDLNRKIEDRENALNERALYDLLFIKEAIDTAKNILEKDILIIRSLKKMRVLNDDLTGMEFIGIEYGFDHRKFLRRKYLSEIRLQMGKQIEIQFKDRA